MASLKAQLDAAGYDVSNMDEDGVLKQLDSAGYDVSDYSKPKSIAEQNLEDLGKDNNAFSELGGLMHTAGQAVKAGYAGLSDLQFGNGLDQAATDVNNVLDEKAPETKAGTYGSAVAEMATPTNLALGEGLGAVAGKVGEVLAPYLKGWGEQAARNAIGFIKSFANKGGVEDLPEVAEFVMNPVKIGEKTLPPILTATSAPREMLANAQNIQQAAKATLGTVSDTTDAAINANPKLIDLNKIQTNLERLKGAVEKNAAELGAPVVAQYEKAIADFNNVISRTPDLGQRLAGTTPTNNAVFSALRNLKTTIGDLMGEGDNVVPSKSALRKIYGVLADELDTAAGSVSKEVGAAYTEANKAYTYATDAVESLKNLIRSEETKPLLPSLKSLFTGAPLAKSTAMASALNTAAQNVAPVAKTVAQAVPGVLSGLYTGLASQGR